MKKISNTEAELKKRVAYKKKPDNTYRVSSVISGLYIFLIFMFINPSNSVSTHMRYLLRAEITFKNMKKVILQLI